MTDGDVTVVNVVGAGSIGAEIDLHALVDDIEADAKYNPEGHTGMHIRLDGGALITLYRTGSYHIVGVDSKEKLFTARDGFFQLLEKVGIEVSAEKDPFSVRNIVTTTDLGDSVNLNALAIGLGLEQVEYEPEQFPGLVYRPTGVNGVVLVFGSGKLVITGVTSVQEAREIHMQVASEVETVL